MNRLVIPLLIFIVLIGFLGVGLTLNPRDLPSPFIDKPAPTFSLPRLFDTQRFDSAQMKGEVWLLNVWASWCVSCSTEHPLLLKLAQADSLRIVGLNYKDDSDDAARAWLQRFGNPYTYVAIDARGDVAIEYGVYGVPETYLIDKRGVIRFKHTGPLNADVLQHLLPVIEKLNEESS